MRRTQRHAAFVIFALVTAVTLSPVKAIDPSNLRPYTGNLFPGSASGWGVLNDFQDGPFDGNQILGYYLDVDGDGRADVALEWNLDPSSVELFQIVTAIPSPSDSYLVFATGYRHVNLGNSTRTDYGLVPIRFEAGEWRAVAPFVPWNPVFLMLPSVPSAPDNRSFFNTWSNIMAARVGRDGKDFLFAVATKKFSFESRYSFLIDGPDADAYPDTWTQAYQVPLCEAIACDDRGNLILRRILDQTLPQNTSAFVSIADADGDGIPEPHEPNFILEGPFLNLAFGAFGPGDLDQGADRLLSSAGVVAIDLDSNRRPIAGSVRNVDHAVPFLGGISYDPHQIIAGHDGSAVVFADDERIGQTAIARYVDLNFDDLSNNNDNAVPHEVISIVDESQFGETPFLLNAGLAELSEIQMPTSGGTNIAFRDFGVYPNDESFTFRFGSTNFHRVWVSNRGLVCFGLPGGGTASLDALSALPGAVAAAWSDEWDTSRVRVFVGYAPAAKSFVTGERVLTFAIEWRDLRAPGWEPNRACSVRLLLYSDGTFRTDFGALEASEIGEMRLVTGYSGPGAHASVTAVDASAHSWKSGPAGVGVERVAAEAFGSGKSSDIGHKWVRWTGYPERLDTPGPKPVLVNPTLKNRSKVAIAAAGSNIVEGARLLVDGADVFRLTRSASSKKWVVGKREVSLPGGRTVRQIWSDDRPHEILVVNPDGEASASTPLGP